MTTSKPNPSAVPKHLKLWICAGCLAPRFYGSKPECYACGKLLRETAEYHLDSSCVRVSPLAVERCVKCGHDFFVLGRCAIAVPIVGDDMSPPNTRPCGCKCEFSSAVDKGENDSGDEESDPRLSQIVIPKDKSLDGPHVFFPRASLHCRVCPFLRADAIHILLPEPQWERVAEKSRIRRGDFEWVLFNKQGASAAEWERTTVETLAALDAKPAPVDAQIEAIRERRAKITEPVADTPAGDEREANMEFIANAPTDIATLLAAVRSRDQYIQHLSDDVARHFAASESLLAALERAKVAPVSQSAVAWKTPDGEGATGYNAAIYSAVYKDVVGVVERERLQKQDDSPARRRNYAKSSTWQNQLVNSLVQRIMNLRLMLAKASSVAPLASSEGHAGDAETIKWLQKVHSMGVSENSVVPQLNAGEMLARLDELGFGKQEPRRGNTLWAMVMDAADEIERLRSTSTEGEGDSGEAER